MLIINNMSFYHKTVYGEALQIVNVDKTSLQPQQL